jgi:2-polyprenyl-3-methyl-5-hydroxy-6-metoxy-1,4-benzoquinol methylase
MHTRKTVQFYDARAARYFDEWKDNQLLMPLLRCLVSLVPPKPRILDVGCGPGVESRRLVDLGAEVVGIDLSEKSLQLARQYVPQARFLRMDVLDLDFASSSFDGVLDSAVLFHFTEDEQRHILKTIHRILNRDGLLLSIYRTGKYRGLQERVLDGNTFTRYVNLKSVAEWTNLVLSVGFSKEEELELNDKSFRAVLFAK